MKRLWPILFSLILLILARLLMMLFVFFLDSITGQLALGYILGWLLFGTLAALPVLIPLLRSSMRVGWKVLAVLGMVCLYAGLLFLTSLSTGPKTRP